MAASSGNKCPGCKGIGLKVREVPTALYACGFYTQAYTCPDCLGSGRIMPQSIQPIVIDHKLAAAGDAQ